MNFLGFAILVDGMQEAAVYGDSKEAYEQACLYYSQYKDDGHNTALVAVLAEQVNQEFE